MKAGWRWVERIEGVSVAEMTDQQRKIDEGGDLCAERMTLIVLKRAAISGVSFPSLEKRRSTEIV